MAHVQADNDVPTVLGSVNLHSQRLVVGLWLMFLYGAAVWLVLATLVSFHFQADISAASSKEDVLEMIDLQSRRLVLERQLRLKTWRKNDIDFEIGSLKREREFFAQDDPDRKKELERRIADREFEAGEIDAEIEITKADLKKLKDDPAFSESDAAAEKTREIAGDFLYMRIWGFEPVALMPGQFLTLILTISMGAFGSVIHLTWEFFEKKEHRRLSWYLFRPFLGAVLAFAIYILLKSGQLVLTNSSGNGNGAQDLNPYFISFLAIISGILSEQAYARISAAGTRIFTSQERKRWVRKAVAEAAMEARKLDVDDLCGFMGPRAGTKPSPGLAEKAHCPNASRGLSRHDSVCRHGN